MQFVSQRAKLLSTFIKCRQLVGCRPLALGKPYLKWVTGKEVLSAEMPVGSSHGHPDDPERNTRTIAYTHIEGKDEPIPEYMYRDTPKHRNYLDRFMHKLLSSIFFSWFFYNLYWNSALITGHHSLPYLNQFTDAELGIPPDDAEDPEYWGHHGQPARTYR